MISTTENIGPTAASEVSLAAIEGKARLYADRRDDLAGVVRVLNDQVEALKRSALPEIKRAVARAAEAHGKLRDLVEGAPGLFVKPRTVIFHGIKVGFEKGKGKLVFENGDRVCELINKHFPELTEALIIVSQAPNRKALGELAAADLKRLGVTVEDTGDQVVIRPTDTAVDKVVNALLKEAVEEKN